MPRPVKIRSVVMGLRAYEIKFKLDPFCYECGYIPAPAEHTLEDIQNKGWPQCPNCQADLGFKEWVNLEEGLT